MMVQPIITKEEIHALVKAFYTRVRKHDVLGPIFADAIGKDTHIWEQHEEKIASFWRNAVGIDRSYNGNPLVVHSANRAVQREHFQVWLNLFRKTAEEILNADSAAEIADLADRIGQSLSFGIEQFRKRTDAVPDLST